MVKLKSVVLPVWLSSLFLISFAHAGEFSLYPNPQSRYVGMGSAYVASIGGPAALLCNPAGLIGEHKYSIAFNIGNSSDYNEQFIAGGFQLGSSWAIGLGVHRLSLESQDGDSVGLLAGVASELIEEELTVGGTVQGFINAHSVKGVRISLGMQYTPWAVMTIGTFVASRGVFENDAGTKIKIPYHAKTGVQLRPFSWISVNIDAELARKNKQREDGELVRVNYGFEWKIPIEMVSSALSEKIRLYARGGSRSGIVEAKEKGSFYTWKRPWEENGLSLGFGAAFSLFRNPTMIDVASDEYSRLFISLQTSVN